MPSASTSTSPVKNRSQWTMPLDEFVVYPLQLDSYVDTLLMSECLAEAGYDVPAPWQDTRFPPPADVNRVELRLFNVEIASLWGYHPSPPADVATSQAVADFYEYVDTYNPDPEYDGVFADCTERTRRPTSTDAINDISALAIQSEHITEQKPEVIAALARWRECVAEQVNFDVPEDPMEMPPRPLAEEFGMTGPKASATISSEELALAVLDANCRESSRWSELQYEGEWKEQLKLIVDNRDNLDRNRAADVAREKELLQIVAEHAPAAPR